MSSTSVENRQNIKWWGWGLEEKRYALPDPQHFWFFLEQSLGPLQQSPRLASLDQISLPPSRLAPADLQALKVICGDAGVSIDAAQRLKHALGQSYIDLLQIRRGRIEAAPDGIVFPQQEAQVRALLQLATDRDWTVVPFGGGTTVVGGVAPAATGQIVVTLDLRRLDRVLGVDVISNTARVQAGIRGPELEVALNRSGLTLGHFPQSFEFSTLGGWIATRSAGQNSTMYGKIEDMVVSLRLVSPTGVLDSPVVPAEAVGPSLLQCLIGSEGTLGVITEAVVRLHPLARERAFGAYLFPDFPTGMDAVRDMLQAGLRPAVLRLSDPDETFMALRLSQSAQPSFKEKLGKWYVGLRGFNLEQGALLILIFEGTPNLVSAAKRASRPFLKKGLALGGQPARMWTKSRFDHPYLRDDLLDRAVMVDTLETAAPWQTLPSLYAAVRQALCAAIGQTASSAMILGHLSHAYPDGASLYFTFMARQQAGRELEQWQMVKEAATQAILEHGGALSHHHGIGRMHKPWMRPYLGQRGLSCLQALKDQVDPNNIMNPGKLLGD